MSAVAVPRDALDRAHELLARGHRVLLGLVGVPGSGKSALARALAHCFAKQAVVVPMDGFHLANAELARLGRASRKGAPDTFDAAGYVALLRRLRAPCAGETVYAPEFRRDIEEAVAGAIAVDADARLVITEGNYLLLDEGPWRGVRALLDETWFVTMEDAVRRERLVQRHIRFGRTPADAAEWMRTVDEPNARLIEACRSCADRVMAWREGGD